MPKSKLVKDHLRAPSVAFFRSMKSRCSAPLSSRKGDVARRCLESHGVARMTGMFNFFFFLLRFRTTTTTVGVSSSRPSIEDGRVDAVRSAVAAVAGAILAPRGSSSRCRRCRRCHRPRRGEAPLLLRAARGGGGPPSKFSLRLRLRLRHRLSAMGLMRARDVDPKDAPEDGDERDNEEGTAAAEEEEEPATPFLIAPSLLLPCAPPFLS